MTVEEHCGPEVEQYMELALWLRRCMAETRVVSPSTESELASFAAHEGGCEVARHLFSFLFPVRQLGIRVRLCAHCLRRFRRPGLSPEWVPVCPIA